jgi:hypothetical protein
MSVNWIDGVWTGTGYQQEGTLWTIWTIWTIKFTADENKNQFLIEYPSLNESSGVWKLLEKVPVADRYTFDEIILHQGGNTMDGGKIVITKVNDTYMSFSYFEAPLCKTVTSWSTLKKQ